VTRHQVKDLVIKNRINLSIRIALIESHDGGRQER